MFAIYIICYWSNACDGQTDGRTDRILITRPRLHSTQRGNKTTKVNSKIAYLAQLWRYTALPLLGDLLTSFCCYSSGFAQFWEIGLTSKVIIIIMRYINRRFTYLLTYISINKRQRGQTKGTQIAHCNLLLSAKNTHPHFTHSICRKNLQWPSAFFLL